MNSYPVDGFSNPTGAGGAVAWEVPSEYEVDHRYGRFRVSSLNLARYVGCVMLLGNAGS